jgi:hypothetical protein
MRLAKAIALAGALAAIAAASASAAPVMPNAGTEQATNIVQVAGGCGRGFHPNHWGRCVPNRYGYYRPYWSGPYHRWHEPHDYVANDLNRRQLGGYRWGY